MIYVTRLDGSELVVNSDMIEFVEATPDTILTLTDGKKVLVQESTDEILERIIQFRNRVLAPMNGSATNAEHEER